MLDLSKLTHDKFEPCLNQSFVIEAESSENITLELMAVETRGAFNPASNRQTFSLLFRGPLNPAVEQGIVPLTHEALGRLDLFLVPIGPDEVGMRYEAVFT